MLRHDLITLRLFARACELRSLTRASEELNIAASAASRRLRLLEHEAATPLLKRRPHGVEPTPAGLAMLRYAREVLELGDRLAASLDEYRTGARGHVRVFASSSVLVQRLASDLSRFARDNPAIKIDLEERPSIGTIEGLVLKQADIGVIVKGVETEGLETFPYSSDRLSLVVPVAHPLASRASAAFDDILSEELVSLDSGTAVYRLVSRQAREAGRYLKIRVQVRSFEVMCQMIGQGLGIGILPEHAARPLAAALGLAILRLEEPWAERAFEICVRSVAALDAPARRLLEALQASDPGVA
jgi:DNA-binding transcriptional LysR family regulator